MEEFHSSVGIDAVYQPTVGLAVFGLSVPLSAQWLNLYNDQITALGRCSISGGETYGYDAFGNLLSKARAGGAPTLSQAVNPANNEIAGQTYRC